MISLPNIADGEDKSSVLANRIRKNYRHVRKWAKRTETDCFRIYDWEIPSYALAIDFYASRFSVHYFPKTREEPEPPASLIEEVEKAIGTVFGVGPEALYWRIRVKRDKLEQYEKADVTREFFIVTEYGVKFWVNLRDYLDTGLFLDHRETRRLVALGSEGKKVLNLFAYTCSFSVHAALAGAIYTKSVDLSNTYTLWGRDNFILNGISKEHHPIIRDDCLKFLDDEREKYDIIVIDPPTISRSKKMDQIFDIQIDYPDLINKARKLLNPNGILYFSTNSRKFKFDESLFPGCKIQDVSKKTIPIDFHDPKIHRCWILKY